MTRAIARFEKKSAPLSSEFGLSWATKLFGEEAIASLEVLKAGPNKGKPKGFIHWTKCVAGGWDRETHSAYGVGSYGEAWIALGELSYHRSAAMTGRWLGRTQQLGAMFSARCFFQEGRDRHDAEITAERVRQDEFAAELREKANQTFVKGEIAWHERNGMKG